MAYIKGGTVIDGNLFVEGGLRVKQITTSSGKSLPSLYDDTSSVAGRLVKFMDTKGALHYSKIEESTSGNTAQFNVINGNYNDVNLLLNDNSVCNVQFNNIGTSNSELTLTLYPSGSTTASQTLKFKASGLVISYSPDQINLGTKVLTGFSTYTSGSATRYKLQDGYYVVDTNGTYIEDSSTPEIFGYKG